VCLTLAACDAADCPEGTELRGDRCYNASHEAASGDDGEATLPNESTEPPPMAADAGADRDPPKPEDSNIAGAAGDMTNEHPQRSGTGGMGGSSVTPHSVAGTSGMAAAGTAADSGGSSGGSGGNSDSDSAGAPAPPPSSTPKSGLLTGRVKAIKPQDAKLGNTFFTLNSTGTIGQCAKDGDATMFSIRDGARGDLILSLVQSAIANDTPLDVFSDESDGTYCFAKYVVLRAK
jgi:hypothetical protein